MIPSAGPAETDSSAERRIYHLLKAGLPEDFVVIHSLPWLCSSVRMLDASYPPTGEIDFLIVHAELGILALEVKGGVHRTEGAMFVHVNSGRRSHPVRQARKNAHGLARWLGHDPGLRFRIGYGFIFPDSNFGEAILDAAMVDTSASPPEAIFIDRGGLPELAFRVQRMMAYWKKANSTGSLGSAHVARLIRMLCPQFDGTPNWAARVEYDNRIWLRLTPEQSAVVDATATAERVVVNGWPGTGKTLIAIELARRLVSAGQKVLALTFNNLLADHLRSEIARGGAGQVATWHGFCSTFSRKLRGTSTSTPEWMERGCLDDLQEATDRGLVPKFEALLVDEAQTLKQEWCDWLARHFQGKKIIVFCDETQLFSFEKERISTAELCARLGTNAPFSLTIPLRSPRVITNFLQRIKAPAYQMFSPRDLEPDALQERVVINVDKALDEVLAELDAQGLSRTDIVVLSKFAPAREYSGQERYETISRFRGMESPAIVVAWADLMDDVELFCAYSRATTICVAIYDAENLGFAGANGRFQELLLAEPANAALAQEASEQASTRSIVAAHVSSTPLLLQSARVFWCSGWRAWLVDCQDDDEAADLWIDYLVCHHHWPVYSWTSKSRRELFHSSTVHNAVDHGHDSQRHSLALCGRCQTVAPFQRQHTGDLLCKVCTTVQPNQDEPSQQLQDLLREYDRLLCSAERVTREELGRLPLSLAALGARRLARSRAKDHRTELLTLPTGGVLYRAAMAFVYARISLLRQEAELELDRTAEATGRFVLPPGVTQDAWRSKVALALGRSFSKQLLTKKRKGLYATSRRPTIDRSPEE
jgi:hypothetical protein